MYFCSENIILTPRPKALPDAGAEPAEPIASRLSQDLSPMLREALDKLWSRPYDCRIFTLQFLQLLAQLDNSDLCMMTVRA